MPGVHGPEGVEEAEAVGRADVAAEEAAEGDAIEAESETVAAVVGEPTDGVEAALVMVVIGVTVVVLVSVAPAADEAAVPLGLEVIKVLAPVVVSSDVPSVPAASTADGF